MNSIKNPYILTLKSAVGFLSLIIMLTLLVNCNSKPIVMLDMEIERLQDQLASEIITIRSISFRPFLENSYYTESIDDQSSWDYKFQEQLIAHMEVVKISDENVVANLRSSIFYIENLEGFDQTVEIGEIDLGEINMMQNVQDIKQQVIFERCNTFVFFEYYPSEVSTLDNFLPYLREVDGMLSICR